MVQRAVRAAIIGTLFLGIGLHAGAQPDERQTEEAERRAPRVPGEVEAFAPIEDAGSSPTRPGLTGGEAWETLVGGGEAGASAPIAERTFLNQVRGAVLAGPHGTRVLVTDASATGVPAAMLLLPCGVLERFDDFVFKRHERVPAVVSGQVFVYGGRNYLLPSAIRAAAEGDPTRPVVPTGPEPNRAEEEPTADGDRDGAAGVPDRIGEADGPTTSEHGADPVREAEVDALLRELERRPVYSRRRRGTRDDPPDAAGGVAGEPPVRTGAPNRARYIAARRGRMLRDADGSWLFAEDNDGGVGARMTLLPCRMLQAVEGVALREGDDAAVLLSGRVYRYHGRDYVLPTLYQRERRAGVDPLQ